MVRTIQEEIKLRKTYTVTEVGSSKQGNGFYYRLDDKYVFAPYHLKKVVDYDLI